MIDRAIFLHDQISSLLVDSYKSLQDYIIQMKIYLTEYEHKKMKLGNFFYFYLLKI
jgi:hypothetical protein